MARFDALGWTPAIPSSRISFATNHTDTTSPVWASFALILRAPNAAFESSHSFHTNGFNPTRRHSHG
nr:hypothetical protein [Klugiella xanthotipulae]